jgi:Tol biopolymer transport system component
MARAVRSGRREVVRVGVRVRAVALPAVVMALAAAACRGGVPGGSPTPTPTTIPAAPSGAAASPSPLLAEDVAWILYFQPDFENQDGRNAMLRRLRPGTDETAPALSSGPTWIEEYDWSPDGARFAYLAWDPPTAPYDPASTLDLWVADWDGANSTRLVDCAAPCWMAGGPAWSPDGGRIAFNRTDAVDGTITSSSVQVLDLASGQIETILDATPPAVVGGGDWSGDGRSLLVGQARLRSTRISDLFAAGTYYTETGLAVLDLDAPGSTPRPLQTPDLPVGGAAWQPTGDLVAFDAGHFDNSDPAHSTSELYMVRADGTGLAQLTDVESVGAAAFGPSWSPDGTTILFSLWHRASYTPTLASIRPDGSGLEELGGDARVVGLYPRQRPVPASR